MSSRVFAAGIALLAGAVLAILASAAEAQAIRVGSKNFTEQFIIGEMYAAALEANGIKVQRRINLGGTLIAHKALTANEIDLYPEYTGTALNSVLKAPMISDPDAVYKQVKTFYEREFEVTWLKPSRVNNGYAILVRPETAQQFGLKTLSDLAKVSKQLRMGGGPEFADRQDGLPGLKAKYNVEFAEFKQFGSLAERYNALTSKQVDAVNGFATDWQIAAGKFVALEDDKKLFPPYVLAPAVRMSVLKANPKIETIVNQVSALVDNDVMSALNQQVEVKKDEPRDVARAFLKAKGIVK
jgi:osmoprotectant transport system substrate-binding protein